MSKYLDIMRVGDDYVLKLEANINNVPIDITGYKYWFTLKSSFADLDSSAVLQFITVVGDNPNDDAINGICYISVPASITRNVLAGSYFYDVQQKSSISGEITTLLPPAIDYKDKIIVVPEVTRAVA